MQPEQNFLTSLEAYPLDQVALRRIFLILTRFHYSDSDNFGLKRRTLEKYIYSPDTAKSRLNVFLEGTQRMTTESLYPAVVVDVPRLEINKVVLDNRSDNDGGQGLVAQSPLMIHHYSPDADESLLLANTTCAFFTGFCRVLRDRMRLRAFIPSGVAGPEFAKNEAGKDFQLYRSTFQALIHYDYSWVLEFESHLLREITINIAEKFS